VACEFELQTDLEPGRTALKPAPEIGSGPALFRIEIFRREIFRMKIFRDEDLAG
jgi:hypothetical protein